MKAKLHMNKIVFAGISLLFALAALAMFSVSPSRTNALLSNQPSRCAPNAAACIALLPEGPSRDIVYVKAGEQVQFNSADGASHNLYLRPTEHNAHGDDHAHDAFVEKESGAFGADEAWVATFAKTGTYVFEDSQNHHSRVTVIVYSDQLHEII